MTPPAVLHGYHLSVYNRAARLVLHEKGVDYRTVEVNPFADDVQASYRSLHPFGRVPVLVHGDFSLYETVAIARYVDAAFDGPRLTPDGPRAAASMTQIVSIVDSYGYWPMVRQVCVQRVFQPLEGEAPDEAEIVEGLHASARVLAAFDAIASEGLVLDGNGITLADCHLAPMIAYFAMAPEGAEALARHAALSRWWDSVRRRKSFADTGPGL